MAAYKDLVGQKITKVTSNPGEPKTGQMWYNSTVGNFRALSVLEAWSTASNLVNVRRAGFGAGTQTAALAAFGRSPSAPIGSFTTSEEYNGTGWTFGGTANTARFSMAGSGTQTAAVGSGGYNPPGSPAFNFAATEEYDGSSWTSTGDLSTARSACAGFGIQTAAVNVSGYSNPGSVTGAAEHYNGSSWTSGGSLNTTTQKTQGSCGTQTAGLAWGGDPPGPATGSNVTELYDGSTWTTGNTTNINRSYTTRAGTQTDAVCAGGYGQITTTETFNGTSWSTSPATLGTGNQDFAGADGTSTAAFACGGNLGPTFTSATEEYNKSTNAVTGAAFSSGGSANTARRQLGYTGAGTQNAFMVYGGFSPSGMLNASEEYGGSTWTATPNLNTARGQNAGFGITTAAVACGGATPTIGGYTEEYNGSSWTTGNSMSTNRYEFGATGILTAGLALQGDQGPSTPFGTTCEQYDGTNWSSAGTASTARRTNSGVGTQTATITAGGQIPGPSATANVESYDGTSFSEVNNLNVARGGNAIMGGPAGATSSVITGGNVPTQFSISEQWNGTSMVSGVSMANDRSTHGAGGTSASGIVGLGQIGPSPPYGDADTEEYVGETTAANIETFGTE